MAATECAFLVVGGGIAGASAAAALAAHGATVLLERESRTGYHTTGRSAAIYTEIYGHPVIRALAMGSRGFLEAAHEDGFCAHPLLEPRGCLMVGRADQEGAIADGYAEGHALLGDAVRRIGAEQILELAPMMRPGYAAAALWEPGARGIDVAALHDGFQRLLRHRGGRIVTDAEVTAATRDGAAWRLDTPAGSFTAPVVVNAAGAWADVIGRRFGAAPIGLVPKRRTAITFAAADEAGADLYGDGSWPLVVDVEEQFYFKPEAGKVMGSPADETPSAPTDAQPEELDIAVAVDRLETATRFSIRRIEHKWAGLRSFVADKVPVVGFDETVPGLFWLAGQGGYGIKTSPAMARLAAGLVTAGEVPGDLAALGIAAAALAPARCRRAAAAAE